jgi:OOP family OmpA-OmpF porin
LAGAMACALCTPAAASDAVGWYLGLGAGWDHLGNVQIRYTPGGPNDDLHGSDSALITGSFGYRMPIGLRVEVEAGWDRHDLKSTGVNSTGDNGRLTNFSGLLNAAYDWHLTQRWDFTLGAGVGVARNDIDVSAPGVIVANGQHTNFMWQAMAGFSYSISDNLDLTLDWRYREFSARSGFGTSRTFVDTTGTHFFSANLRNNNEQAVMIGLRWYLVEAAPPPPPPAPPPPPPVKTFIVFFDFNKSNLTAEAQAVVSEAVKTAKTQGAVRILVTGHTDTVGSHEYNQGLSERRAASVKGEMVNEGMSPDDISTVGKSFDDPLVPTGPGVREPQNRRAVIDLGGGG